MDVSLLQTTRGANFLTLHGYTYWLNNRVSTTGGGITIYWKCSQCRVGRAITDYDGLGNCFWQREGTRHAPTCLPNPGRIAVEQVRQQYLAAAGDIDNILLRPSSLRQVFSQIREVMPPDQQVELGQYRQIRRTAGRRRSANWDSARSPHTLLDLPDNLPVIFTNIRQEPFVLAYEDYDEADRSSGTFIMFGTRTDLDHLVRASSIFIDGTFKVLPIPFTQGRSGQLFTINSLYGVENSECLYTRI